MSCPYTLALIFIIIIIIKTNHCIQSALGMLGTDFITSTNIKFIVHQVQRTKKGMAWF